MKFRRFCLIFLVTIILLSGCIPRNPAAPNPDSCPLPPDTCLRGAWVAVVWNIDFPKDAKKSDIDKIVNKAAANKLNALFFQVRPWADAVYHSEIFPWSSFINYNGFDVLEYMIKKCHESGIKLHAWINPFRGLPYSPSDPHAREIILAGVTEIIENYDVDGIHYDDYFYPEGFIDDLTPDERRNCIDELIRQTHELCRAAGVIFGVSPSGIWANKSNNPLGSKTLGFESYYAIYADSRGWVKKGYVDYIAPQIYWYRGQKNSDFDIVFDWWRDVCTGTDVLLYIGLAGYKVGTGGAWNKGELSAQMELAAKYANGYIVFSFTNV